MAAKKPTAKKPAAKKTHEQLKNSVWIDEARALADLKASGLARRGEDYELREYRPGAWQLMPLDNAPKTAQALITKAVNTAIANGAEPIREQAVLQALRKKPATEAPRAQPEAPVDGKAAEPPAEPPASSVQSPQGDSGLFGDPPDPNAELFTPVPAEEGPYELIIAEGSEAFPRHAGNTAAIDLSRRLGCIVVLRSANGKITRTYDWSVIKLTQAATKKERGSAPRKAGDKPGAESKFARAAKLLFRKQGATAAELERECGWESVTQRYINRASAFNGYAKITVLGDRHWRLEKPAS